MEKRARLYWIDVMRGVTILSMILYHGIWDLVYLFHYQVTWFNGWKAAVWQQIICISFILLAGFCFHFDKHPLKRGFTIILLGTLISVVTIFFLPDDKILFGILTFLGFSILAMSFFHKFRWTIQPKLGIFVSFVGFFLFQNINHGLFGIKGIYTLKLPSFLYQYRIFAFFGFPDEKFKSSDYFPFIPWIFIFLLGYYLFFLWERQPQKIDVKESTLPWIQWIGRKSLLIYMIHQPVIYLLLYAMNKIGSSLN